MQSPQYVPASGDLVRVRRQRWRVLQAHADGDVVLLSLTGASAVNAGTIQPFIAPFDIVEPATPALRVRRAPARRWRRSVRSLIASTAPPGSLRTLARAHVDLLPHQLEPALAMVGGRCTRVLLADEVGLGKTIEAGLIVAELRERAAASRVLVLTPAGLRDQWQAELRDRFGVHAPIADTRGLAAVSAAYVGQPNPWRTYDIAIASIDLVKRPEHLSAILRCGWDLLIVDEAHNAAAETDRYAAVHAIAQRTPYLVLVTATPHNGDREAFSSLCGIGSQGEACSVFRRSRTEVGLGGARRIHRLFVAPTSAERRMHDALAAFTRAVTREHRETNGDAWLALSVLNKRALSSAHALHRSVTRRLEVLASIGRAPVEPMLPFGDPDGELDPGDASPAWLGGPVLADAGREERLLMAVARSAAEAAAGGETKLRAIGRWLRRVAEPLIVFSEYRDTLHDVAGSIGRQSLQLHGGLTAAERRSVLAAFPSQVPILLATDAAGEGLNLHERCRVVVNLELPWNPVRLEQRIGRVDRIGQARTVHALVLVARGTPEELILERLRSRIVRARHDLVIADPLGVATEADVQRLVLRGSWSERTGAAEVVEGLVWPALAADAAAEVARARTVRAVAGRGRGGDGRDCDVGVTRHRVTRSRLGRRVLVLTEITVEDGSGGVIDRTLVPLSIEPDTTEWGDDVVLARQVINLITGSTAITLCRERAKAAALSFASARASRARAIATAASVVVSPPLQPGLFDRRAERAAACMRGAAEAAREALERRATAAERAARGCVAHVAVRVVVRAGR